MAKHTAQAYDTILQHPDESSSSIVGVTEAFPSPKSAVATPGQLQVQRCDIQPRLHLPHTDGACSIASHLERARRLVTWGHKMKFGHDLEKVGAARRAVARATGLSGRGRFASLTASASVPASRWST